MTCVLASNRHPARALCVVVFLQFACESAPVRRADAPAEGGPAEGDDARLSGPADEQCRAGSEPITVETLLAEMHDLQALSRSAAVRFSMHEASSYDRASVLSQGSSDTAGGWYANHDWGNYLRTEVTWEGRTEYVMLDADGPGAIVRMWTATPAGILRVYLDGEVQPALVAEFKDLLSGRTAPFGWPFATVNSIGHNLDFPIPFSKHAKVTIEGDGPAYFYQVFHRSYADCAVVQTFKLSELKPSALQRTVEALHSAQPAPSTRTAKAQLSRTKPALKLTVPDGGQITEIRVSPTRFDPATLRTTALSLTFDGRETVRAPLGDFFGAGPGLIQHRSLPLEAGPDGTFISRFVMPFARTATISISPQDPTVTVAIEVAYSSQPVAGGAYYFFAHWTARGPLPTRPFRDINLANLKGEGRYVGTLLSIDSRSSEWWGEGDEKIWIDGDTFPSLFGTGTEDYFGYAYSSREPFDHPYRLQSVTGTARGQVANARFHVLDAIPFRESLRFDMELWHWDPAASIYFDSIVYFYGTGATFDAAKEATTSVLRLPPP